MRGRWHIAALVALVTSVGLCAAATGRPLTRKILPKGTAYAAEVRAIITGTVSLSVDNSAQTYNVCEAAPSTSDSQHKYHLAWKVTYPNVTVPVAGFKELGRAYQRLHVPAQPTSYGTGGLVSSSYRITGHSPSQPGFCDQVAYDGSGSFYAAGRPAFTEYSAKDFAALHFFTFLLPLPAPTPATVAIPGGTEKVANDLDADTRNGPQLNSLISTPTYNTVPARFDLGKLRLLTRALVPSVELPSHSAGTADCGSGSSDTGAGTCTVAWNYDYSILLERKFLYRTKRAYPR